MKAVLYLVINSHEADDEQQFGDAVQSQTSGGRVGEAPRLRGSCAHEDHGKEWTGVVRKMAECHMVQDFMLSAQVCIFYVVVIGKKGNWASIFVFIYII